MKVTIMFKTLDELIEHADFIAKQVLQLHRQGKDNTLIAKILEIPEEAVIEGLAYAIELEAVQRNPNIVRNNYRIH